MEELYHLIRKRASSPFQSHPHQTCRIVGRSYNSVERRSPLMIPNLGNLQVHSIVEEAFPHNFLHFPMPSGWF